MAAAVEEKMVGDLKGDSVGAEEEDRKEAVLRAED